MSKREFIFSLGTYVSSPAPTIPINCITIFQVAQVQNIDVIFLKLFIIFSEFYNVQFF